MSEQPTEQPTEQGSDQQRIVDKPELPPTTVAETLTSDAESDDPLDEDSSDAARERLQHITEVVREEVRRFWKPKSCLATTRVLSIVLRQLGIKSRPTPVTVVVFNAAGWQQYVEHPDLRPTDWPPGAWSIGVDGSGTFDHSTGGWNGHLVAVADYNDRKWLLDGSLDQVSRPERGIVVSPSVMPLPHGWTGDWQPFASSSGLHLLYGPMRDPGPWRTARDWTGHTEHIGEASGAALERLDRAVP